MRGWRYWWSWIKDLIKFLFLFKLFMALSLKHIIECANVIWVNLRPGCHEKKNYRCFILVYYAYCALFIRLHSSFPIMALVSINTLYSCLPSTSLKITLYVGSLWLVKITNIWRHIKFTGAGVHYYINNRYKSILNKNAKAFRKKTAYFNNRI